nr:superoxide dismutase 6 [Tribolium castaneum]
MGQIIFVWFILLKLATSLELKSYVSDHGLHGTITFRKIGPEIKIITDLNATLEYPNQVWSWAVVEFPVDYTELENRCWESKLGRELVNLDTIYGPLVLPDNGTSEFSTQELQINGDVGIYGKSLLFKDPETNTRICATITMVDKAQEKIAVARFNSPIAGSVHFRWFSTKDNHNDMVVTTDLYHVSNKENHSQSLDFTEHLWKIYATDILDSDKERPDCNFLQLVFDPDNTGDQALGDLDSRLGKIKISTDYKRKKFKTLFTDQRLILLPSDLQGPQRSLYLVIFERKHPDSFLACAKIRYERPINAKVIIQSGGIKGEVRMTQFSKFEPTFVNFDLTTARGDLETRLVYSSSVAGYKIHELPVKPSKTLGQNENSCLTTKFVYNPVKIDPNVAPPSGLGTQNQYLVGDLSGKLQGRNNQTVLVPTGHELSGLYWDTLLPLQGKFSIIHRTLVIYKNTQYPKGEILSEPWICGGIALYEPNFRYQKPIFTAEVIFRYPTVGRVLMRQVRDEPWSDTSILVEYLVHADGAALNNSKDHRWAIHEEPPGKDFYSWKERCLSSGQIYNPYKIDALDACTGGLCRVGDLTARLGTIEISGKIADSDRVSRTMWTDPFVPLTGQFSVLGKSLVVYDDFGPKARGERLACSIIGGVYRRKAVVKDWFPNGVPISVKGKIEFYQQTEYDITNVEVNLQGLSDNSGYHIHITPVEENLEFPCEASSLYDHWNPLNVDPASSPRTYHGTPDQYEMGDLSGKFGTLDNQTYYKTDYNDTMLPLFGPKSIVGRSIIIHKKDTSRWACATIERGYSPSEARELRAIASFHHPDGYAYGYLKMKQLIYNDGSKSDTTIEVKLRHPGKNDRNVTRDHDWAIYVNPVGVDAAVKTQNTRCVAGGYIWNPYFTQLADPLNGDLYRQECGPENPLRCHVGDLSARLGTIDIGLQRKVFTDANFPLEGDVTAIGRSIVIMSPNRRPERYACANIEPDYDIIKYANIEKPPRFVLSQFIEEVREILGIPDWFLTVDSRKTKSLHSDACVQLLLHFKGPLANRLEQDFSRLLASGRLDTPTLYIPGFINTKRKVKIAYKQCGVQDPNEKSKKRTGFFFARSGSNPAKFAHSLIVVIVLSYLL